MATKKLKFYKDRGKEVWDSLIGEYINYVYVFRAGDGRVLYVGKTGDVFKRWGEHCRTSKFNIDEVVGLEVMAYKSPSEAAFAETQGILYYDPPWNKYPIKGYMSTVRLDYVYKFYFDVE